MARGVNEEFAPPTINPGAITCRGDRALKTAYQTDSESGKEANEANTEEVQVSTSFSADEWDRTHYYPGSADGS